MESTHRYRAAHLHAMTRALFLAAGATHPIADAVAGILVNSNLAGHDSHGVLRVPAYLQAIAEGRLQPAAEPQIVAERSNTLVLDGQDGFGHYTAQQAMRLAIEKAKTAGVCCVTFTRIGHIGRLGEYAEMAAAAGCLGLIMVGGGSTRDTRRVTPYGGGAGVLGTNPIAVGAPTGDDVPFVLDFATSALAEGKVQVARSKGLPMPEGVIVDKHCNPTTNPHDFYEGGYLLPFGKHKGYALSLVTCLFAGLGGGFDPTERGLGGGFLQVIHIEAFTSLSEYQQHVRAFLDGIKSTRPAPGSSEVLVPGDFEYRSRRQRLAEGIEVPDMIHRQLHEWGDKLNVDVSEEITAAGDSARYRQ